MPTVQDSTRPPRRTVTLKPREPKLWVLLALAVVHLAGIGCGFHVWEYLDQPGKDPMRELIACGAIDLVLASVAYALYFRRTWRLTPRAALAAFALGAATGLASIVGHLLQFGWY
jgi:hypothetical protein